MDGKKPEDWLWLLNILVMNLSYVFIGFPIIMGLNKGRKIK